jgi:hypothetical protein
MGFVYHFPVSIVTPVDRTKACLLDCLNVLRSGGGIRGYQVVGWRRGFSNSLSVEFPTESCRLMAVIAWQHHDHASSQGGCDVP